MKRRPVAIQSGRLLPKTGKPGKTSSLPTSGGVYNISILSQVMEPKPVLRILKYPHPALRYESKPLRRVDGELKNIVREMFNMMY